MIWRVLIICLLMFMFVGSQLKLDEITQEEMDNFTGRVSYDNLNMSINFQKMGNDKNNTFLVRSIGKFADLYGFFMVEGAIAAIKFGYDNPEYNFELAWKLMFVSLFAILIIPMIYVSLFVGYGIYAIIAIINSIKTKWKIKKMSKGELQR